MNAEAILDKSVMNIVMLIFLGAVSVFLNCHCAGAMLPSTYLYIVVQVRFINAYHEYELSCISE